MATLSSMRSRLVRLGLPLLLLSTATRPAHAQLPVFDYSLASFASWLTPAAAQTSQPPAPQPQTPVVTPTPTPQPTSSPAPQELNCRTDQRSRSPADGNQKLNVVLDPATRWQPVGGTVRFTIKGTDFTPGNLEVYACFRWDTGDGNQLWDWPVSLQVLSTGLNEITLGAVVPEQLGGRPPGATRYDGRLGLVPIADLRVLARGTGAWKRLDVSLPVGITNRWAAAATAAVLVVLAWFGIVKLAKSHPAIRGGPLLRVIANRYGYASLSQLQIMLWTLVIFGGAVYVMVLTGILIDIPAQALTLLGISGVAILGASLPAATASSNPPAPPASVTTPGVVTGLTTVGSPNDVSVVLAWRAPGMGTPATSYLVEQNAGAAAAWAQVAGTSGLYVAVTGLAAGTAYQFRVTAVDAQGTPGTASAPITVRTPAVPLSGPPLQPTGLSQAGAIGETAVTLGWTAPAAGMDGYLVQYRALADTTWTSAPGPVFALNDTVTGLAPGTSYEFRVAAIANGAIGQWTAPLRLTTVPHTPRYADLIIWDGRNEVDVTRIQMLLFTAVAAGFVLLQIWRDDAIPVIPAGMLVLMGISNGVYLAAKFIPPQR